MLRSLLRSEDEFVDMNDDDDDGSQAEAAKAARQARCATAEDDTWELPGERHGWQGGFGPEMPWKMVGKSVETRERYGNYMEDTVKNGWLVGKNGKILQKDAWNFKHLDLKIAKK